MIINEISWMGTVGHSNDEWIELYNNTDFTINLNGWVLKSGDDAPKINLEGEVEPAGFYLLERTDDNTLPTVTADQIYAGALENAGEKLELHNDAGNLIDFVDCDSGWFAGNNTTKQTMERIDFSVSGNEKTNWQMSRDSGGTPKNQNGAAATEIKIEPEPQKAPSPPLYPEGIVFSEILPSPKGADAEEEWIEIFNSNDFEINLSGWQITDVQGAVKIYTFPEGTEIKSKEYLLIPRPATKITLNNDGDELKIIQPNGEIADSVAYENAKTGESYSLIIKSAGEKEWVWNINLTPGAENAISAPIVQAEKEGREPDLEKNKLAAVVSSVKETNKKDSGFLPPMFLALIIALFSGLLIFFLKRLLNLPERLN